jgi:hypothetical protein
MIFQQYEVLCRSNLQSILELDIRLCRLAECFTSYPSTIQSHVHLIVGLTPSERRAQQQENLRLDEVQAAMASNDLAKEVISKGGLGAPSIQILEARAIIC